MASPKTWSEFRVDLGQLHHAIGVVRREHDQISEALNRIASEFDQCRDDWHTPAAVTFDNVKVWLTTASADLNALLSDMVTRMQTAYNNYKHTEEVNSKNLELDGKSAYLHRESHDDGKRAPLHREPHDDGDHGEQAGKLLRQTVIPVRLRTQYLHKD
jgi:WXG100 family type VII secretion target